MKASLESTTESQGRNDTTSDATLTAPVLGIIGVVVPALVNDQRASCHIRELQSWGVYSLVYAVSRRAKLGCIPLVAVTVRTLMGFLIFRIIPGPQAPFSCT